MKLVSGWRVAAKQGLTLHPTQEYRANNIPQNSQASPSVVFSTPKASLRFLRGMDHLVSTGCPLLLGDHDDESLEVGERPPLLDGGALLGEARLLPLLDDDLRRPHCRDR